MIQIAALRSRLEKQPTDLRPYASYIRDDALVRLDLGAPLSNPPKKLTHVSPMNGAKAG
jgi:hypothetical protein